MATVQQAVLNIKKLAQRDARRYTLDCANRIIRRTPVDTGMLRGGWQPSINAPINTEINRVDKNNAAVSADIKRESDRLVIGDIFYMTNNLPYAARIEYDGWSQQAVQGMMRVSVIEVAAAINAGRK
jgi:hypothetical protein